MACKIELPATMKRSLFNLTLVIFTLLGLSTPVLACDFSPTVVANNLVDNGDGTFSFDVLMCVGERGSENGPVIYMGSGLEIIGTSAPELLNPFNGSAAVAEIAEGVITYNFDGLPGLFWVIDDGEAGPCFSFTITVDGDPSGDEVIIENINDNCLNEFSGSWSSPILSNGDCNPDFSVFAPITISGNTNGAGNDCDLRPSDDQTIEVTILCDGFYSFSTCDSTAWDTWLYLSTNCCEGVIGQNDDLCGAQSEISAFLPAGVYYITVEGFFEENDGEFTLIIEEGEPPFKAETGPDQNICETSTVITGNNPAIGTGSWSVLTGNGNILFPDSNSTLVTDLSNGINQFIWTFNNGICVVDSDTITVIAAGNLSIACPPDVSVVADPDACEAIVNYDLPIGSSECSTVTVTQIGGLGSGATFPVGTTLETYLVADTLGNTDSCTVTITVIDEVPPIIECPEPINVGNDEGLCSAVVTFDEPEGSDNCPGATTALVSGLPSGSEFPLGTTVNVYEVTDAFGNTAACSLEITVSDVEPPVFDCPEDIVLELEEGQCFAVVNYDAPSAGDNCPGLGSVFQTGGLGSGSIFPAGVTTETYEVTDAAGNTSVCSFTVSVLEVIPPEITCPESITVNVAEGECGQVVDYTLPLGTDNCPGATTTMLEGLAPGSLFPVGTTVNVYQVTDASGNTAECAFEVTVIDNINPTISCPTDISVENDEGQCGAIVSFDAPVADDNCDGFTVELLTELGSGDFFPVGTTGVAFEVTDASGNTATCSFEITVSDTESPQPLCGDIVADNDEGLCTAVVNYPVPGAIDNCDDTEVTATLESGQGPGGTFPVGTTEEIWSFTDAAGNTSVCTLNIVVVDAEAPQLTCPENQVIVLPEGDCDTEISYVIPEGTDNCPGVLTTLASGPAPGETLPAGEHTVSFEAIDAAGNITECSFTITVIETIDPTIVCPDDIIAYSSADACGTEVDYLAPVGEDNCPGATTSLSEGIGPGGFFPVGSTVETWIVTDLSGNTATCSFNVTVLDTISPVINCPADITTSTNTEECTAVVNYPAPTASDNCDGEISINLISGGVSGSEFPVGVNTIVYEATDESGNSSVCSFTITVEGESEPSITCPANVVLSTLPDSCGAFAQYPLPDAIDACGGDITLVLESGPANGDFLTIGSYTVVYSAINTLGNSVSCSFEITVVDDVAPEILCPEDILIVADGDQCEFVVDYELPVASDNCELSELNLIEGEASGSTLGIGNYTITFEAVDASGNTATCSFTITIEDTVDPTISNCPEDITISADVDDCNAVVNYETPTGSDNCDFTLSLTEGLESGSVFPIGTTTVTWTVTDLSGNTASCSFTVTVTDEIAPVIDCPENIETCDPEVTWNISATDNCQLESLQQTEGPGPGASFPVGTTTVTYLATDASGNTSECSFTVTVENNPDEAQAGPDQLLCDDNATQLEGNTPENGMGMWEIISGNADISDLSDPNATVTNIESGVLELSWTVTGNGICPSTTDFVTITVETGGSVVASPDVTIQPGESASLNAEGTPDGGTYEWTPSTGLSCTDCQNPEASPEVTTTYLVSYTTENGCRYEDAVTVTVFFEIPNGFTPDGDGVNDVWNIPGVTADTEVTIYNRWGNKIFESVGYNEPWDGTYNGNDLPMASYYYVIDFRDGTDPINGTITLIR